LCDKIVFHTALDYLASFQAYSLPFETEKQINLFDAVQRWLERIPFLREDNVGFDFLDQYKQAAENMFERDRQTILRDYDPSVQSAEREKEIKKLDQTVEGFRAMFDESAHNELIKGNSKRLSFKATQAALLIFAYQEEPILHMPWVLLQALIDIDEMLTSWRYRHSLMVHRMIGTKIGTGGSSGYHYLKATIERGRIFTDIGNMSTYLIPRSDLPLLPKSIERALGFASEVSLTESGKEWLEERNIGKEKLKS